MKYFIKIYGCQYNEWDGARLDFLLQKIGLIPAKENEAEIFFVLSCSVRQTAIDRLLGKLKNWRERGKTVFVSGCVLEKDKKKFSDRGAILWNPEKPEEIRDVLRSLRVPVAESKKLSKDLSTSALARRERSLEMTKDSAVLMTEMLNEGNASSAYLPIMIGCNNFCAYCAVPYTRGRERSRPMDEVVRDFKKLVARGYKEIMLLGQNVNSYKNSEDRTQDSANDEKPSHSRSDFAVLLENLNNIPGDFAIRFTSNHPKDMTDDIIAAVKNLPKVKKEIHLPLQSGSNKILKAMNRPYTKEQYLRLVKKIRKEIPEVEILTDTIVGFPGETEEDFQETVEVYKQVNYTQSFTNKYSPRSGTAAFKLGDPISWEEKERRWRILNDIANIKTAD